jgi:glycine oxidase
MSRIVIIGDGIIGRTIAWQAHRRGHHVELLSRQRAGVSTLAAAGMLTPAAEVETAERCLIEFANQSCQRYPDFIAQLQEDSGVTCDYSTAGTMMLALHRDHINDLRHIARAQRRFGMEVRELGSAEVLQAEPNLHPGVVGALYASHDHHVNPCRVHHALGQAMQRFAIPTHHVESITPLEPGTELRSIAFNDGSGERSIDVDYIIAAAGAWTNDVLPEALQLPSRPVKGQFIRLKGAPLLRRVVRTPDVYLAPRQGGELYVGATSEDQGFDTSLTAGAAMDLLYHTWRALPGSYELELLEQGVGFRPSLRDNLPAIGETAHRGLFVATGHYRHGVMLAPATAEMILNQLDGAEDSATPNPFSPKRFKSPALVETA